jgi:hypothetical protein
MKREREEEMKSGRGGAPSIFFFELSSMSTTMGLLYCLGIIGFFAVILWVLINKITAKPVDFTKQKKQERLSKKSSKTNQSGGGSKKTN